MASVARRSVHFLQIPKTCFNAKRPFTSFRHHKSFILLSKICGCAVGGGILYYFAYNASKFNTVYAFRPRKRDDDLIRAVKLTSRERRFIKFASVEYDGQLYMTPQDFLESFVDQEPRPRIKRRVLTEKELEAIKDATPLLHKGSTRMFRDLRDKGIISYTEYLFLLSILTKPKTGFQIAFNMFDTDGNERVDKNEFLVLQKLLIGDVKGDRGELDPDTQKAMEKIFSNAWKDKRGLEMGDPSKGTTVISDEFVDDEQGLQRRHLVDTTLTIHFFGKKGNNELRYEGFRKFMENLQTEVLEMEFNEFSKGASTISEIDFAKILLRYTYLDTDAYDMYLDRLLDRVKEDSGITFQEFKVFCQFLNNLEDFMIAMRMYTLADHPISKDEFHRAVKICTGTSLSSHVVHTVFALFDEDGDGQLSYREFIAIMKDRLHRGFKIATKNEGWEAFKQCVKQEIKSPG